MAQKDLADICTVVHPNSVEYIFFLTARGTVSKIEHTLGHRENVNKHGKKSDSFHSVRSQWHKSENQQQEK